jgi:hypothetical protein
MTTSVNSVNLESDTTTTNRLFAGFLNSIVGADNNYIGEDSHVNNPAGQYVIANPDGSVSVLGQAQSNLQSTRIATGSPPLLMLLGLGALVYFLIVKA